MWPQLLSNSHADLAKKISTYGSVLDPFPPAIDKLYSVTPPRSNLYFITYSDLIERACLDSRRSPEILPTESAPEIQRNIYREQNLY